jgi:hypothetical protein
MFLLDEDVTLRDREIARLIRPAGDLIRQSGDGNCGVENFTAFTAVW